MVADDTLVFTSAIAFVDSCRFQTLCIESYCLSVRFCGVFLSKILFSMNFPYFSDYNCSVWKLSVNKHVFDKQLYESLSLSFLLSTSLWEPCPPFPVFTYSVSSGFPAGSITLVVSVFKYNETESAYLHQLFGK